MIESPDELQDLLFEYFPQYEGVLERDPSDYGYTPELTYHQVWLSFSPVAYGLLSSSSSKLVHTFGSLVSALVDAGGDKENAVTTCFLEHATQIGVKKIIRPHLSKGAQSELR